MNLRNFTNIAFGITFLNLALVGLCALTLDATFPTLVRLGALICNITMGGLLLSSHPASSASSPLDKPYWLGAIICNAAIVKNINDAQPFHCISSFLFIIGLSFTLFSLYSLGRSFAVTPMHSKIKTHKAYTLVRHPIYLGESIMILSCVLATSAISSYITFVLYLLITALRIREEEALLLNEPQYQNFCKKTRWKILPFVW